MAPARTVWLAAAVPPVLWALQGAVGWFIMAHACPPATAGLSLMSARVLVLSLTAVALLVSVVGAVAAWRAWHRISAGDAIRERMRFLALAGLLVGVTVAVGVTLAGLPSIILRACGETR